MRHDGQLFGNLKNPWTAARDRTRDKDRAIMVSANVFALCVEVVKDPKAARFFDEEEGQRRPRRK